MAAETNVTRHPVCRTSPLSSLVCSRPFVSSRTVVVMLQLWRGGGTQDVCMCECVSARIALLAAELRCQGALDVIAAEDSGNKRLSRP